MKPEAAYALLRDKFPTAPLAPPGAAWRRLTQVRTWGAHRRGARREGQGLYSQPREEGLARTRRNARARAERIFRSTPSVVLFHLSRRL